MQLSITEGTIAEAFHIQGLIPEFKNAYSEAEYNKRLSNTPHLILIAIVDNNPVGFKVGYALDNTTFYSWMGGVLPTYRTQHIAQKLTEYQEAWAKEQGIKKIRFKTRNYLKPMLIFALKNGFHITEVERHKGMAEHRIILEKELESN